MSNVAFRSFESGELSPAMYSRADLQRYATGLRTLRNATVLRTGGVQSRAGFEYLASTKSNGVARLIEAVFDDDASYVLEFGNLYIRFWENGALVDVGSPAAWLTATPYTAGLVRAEAGTNYVCLIAHTSGTFATDLAAGKWYALTGTTYEWPTDYVTADLFDLQFAYQLNVVTVVHPTYPPATLTRTSDAVWALADVDFTTATEAPSNVAVSGTGGTDWGYTVTAIFADGSESGAEAYVRTNIASGGVPFAVYTALAAAPRTVTWTAVTDAVRYRVYANEGTAGAVTEIRAEPTGTSFVDNGGFALSYGTPPSPTGNFQSANDYPSVVAAYQQRLLLSGTENDPDIVYASRTGVPYNFSVSNPIVDTDTMEWRQVGRRFNRVRHFAEVAQRLVQFSSVGESIIQGDTDGVLRPGEVNPRQFSENGAAVSPSPLVINDSALYVQARGGIVRDIAPIQASGFTGSDLTLQAAHLVDGYTIVDWTYQQVPDSVVWAVRSDGVLLSLTYVRELGVLGWAHHDTDGLVKSVCCIPENGRDAVYAVIQRTIDGNTVRYVERMSDRLAATPVIMDAYIDTVPSGTDFGSYTDEDVVSSVDVAAGVLRPTAIDADTLLTRVDETATNASHYIGGVTASDALDQVSLSFYALADERSHLSAQMAGAYANIDLTAGTVGDDDPGADTWAVTPTVTNAGNGWWYITMTLQLGAPNPAVGTAIQLSDGVGYPAIGAYNGTAGYGLYLLGVPQVAGLTYLEGETVSVVADGVVIASPNNTAYDPIVVTDGTITLPAGSYTAVTVGLPITTDIQTLDIDSVGRTVKDRGMQVGGVICWVEDSGAFYAGPIVPTGDTLTDLEAFVPTNDEGYATTGTVTGVAEVTLAATYNNTGRVLIRQVDPVPLTILSIAPTGFLNGGR